jgi:hypothetical protein
LLAGVDLGSTCCRKQYASSKVSTADQAALQTNLVVIMALSVVAASM